MLGALPPTPRRLSGDRGEVSSTVLMMPVVLTLLLVLVQSSLSWHARSVLEAAASDGLVAAQTDGGNEEAGRQAVSSILSGSDSGLLRAVDVQVERGDELTTVRVEADVVRLLPIVTSRVRAEASGPTERFRSDTEPP